MMHLGSNVNNQKCGNCDSKQKGSYECVLIKKDAPRGVYVCYLYEAKKKETNAKE